MTSSKPYPTNRDQSELFWRTALLILEKNLLGAEVYSGLGRGLGKPRELNLIRDEQYNLLRLPCFPTNITEGDINKADLLKRDCDIPENILLLFSSVFKSFWLQSLSSTNNTEAIKAFLREKGVDSALDVSMMGAVMKSLRSENGQLDLFVRFLHGLCLESNQRVLGGLLGQTDNSPEIIQKTINNLKEMNSNGISTDRSINIFHCLMEMNECSVNHKIKEFLKAENRSEMELSVIHCSPLAYMLQVSEELLLYSRLSESDCEVFASALKSNDSHLRDLSDNYDIQDSGVKPLLDWSKR